jgi:predicted nuclease of predicted toxin-antitoxin system
VRWLIDECVDAALAALLREPGHDVVYMSDVASRAPDPEVITRADRENRLLVTEDKDFGDLDLSASKAGTRPGACSDRAVTTFPKRTTIALRH